MPRSLPVVLLRALALCLCGPFSACASPRILVDSEPGPALAHRDGRPLGPTPLSFAMPYYGRILLEIDKENEAGLQGSKRSYRPARRMVEFPAPFSPWFFPLDFAGEALVRLFGLPDRRIHIRLEEAAADPTDPAALIRELRSAALAR